MDPVARELVGYVGLDRLGRRDVVGSAGGVAFASSCQAAAIERLSNPRPEFQRGVIVGDGGVELTEPQMHETRG